MNFNYTVSYDGDDGDDDCCYVSVEVQEEIESLYEFVPEVEEHFEVMDKIGEGTCISLTWL